MQIPEDINEFALQGCTLLVGGGRPTPSDAIHALITAAGGPAAPLVILTQAKEDPAECAPHSIALFHKLGARNMDAPVGLSSAQTIALLNRARGVWIPGGDQNLFMAAFPEASGVPAAIRAVWKRGGVVGGTSAGASLMGALMPTGDPIETEGIAVGACPLAPALHILPTAIVDQHFLIRNRLQRLLSAVLEHPQYTGIGLEEGAWATLRGSHLQVGEGQVTLLDAANPVRREGKRVGTDGVTLRILLSGEQTVLTK